MRGEAGSEAGSAHRQNGWGECNSGEARRRIVGTIQWVHETPDRATTIRRRRATELLVHDQLRGERMEAHNQVRSTDLWRAWRSARLCVDDRKLQTEIL